MAKTSFRHVVVKEGVPVEYGGEYVDDDTAYEYVMGQPIYDEATNSFLVIIATDLP